MKVRGLFRLKEWPRDPAERTAYVDSVFGSIAPKYDLVSRLLSSWQDQRWKARALSALPQNGSCQRLLDLATGTGAFPILLRRRGFMGKIVGLDRNRAMLALAGRKCGARIRLIQGDLARLPFTVQPVDLVKHPIQPGDQHLLRQRLLRPQDAQKADNAHRLFGAGDDAPLQLTSLASIPG